MISWVALWTLVTRQVSALDAYAVPAAVSPGKSIVTAVCLFRGTKNAILALFSLASGDVVNLPDAYLHPYVNDHTLIREHSNMPSRNDNHSHRRAQYPDSYVPVRRRRSMWATRSRSATYAQAMAPAHTKGIRRRQEAIANHDRQAPSLSNPPAAARNLESDVKDAPSSLTNPGGSETMANLAPPVQARHPSPRIPFRNLRHMRRWGRPEDLYQEESDQQEERRDEENAPLASQAQTGGREMDIDVHAEDFNIDALHCCLCNSSRHNVLGCLSTDEDGYTRACPWCMDTTHAADGCAGFVAATLEEKVDRLVAERGNMLPFFTFQPWVSLIQQHQAVKPDAALPAFYPWSRPFVMSCAPVMGRIQDELDAAHDFRTLPVDPATQDWAAVCTTYGL